MLSKSVDSQFNVVVLQTGYIEACLRPGIIRDLMHGRDHRHIVRAAVIYSLVVMIERRNRQQQVWIKCVDPGESDVPIGFTLTIAKAVTGINLISGRVGIRIDGDLIIIVAQRCDQPEWFDELAFQISDPNPP